MIIIANRLIYSPLNGKAATFIVGAIGSANRYLDQYFGVLIISLGIDLALVLGLSSRAVVNNILAGAFVREHHPQERETGVQGIVGRIVCIGSVGTTIESQGPEITVPNIVLREKVIE
jgi:hypothetical protein